MAAAGPAYPPNAPRVAVADPWFTFARKADAGAGALAPAYLTQPAAGFWDKATVGDRFVAENASHPDGALFLVTFVRRFASAGAAWQWLRDSGEPRHEQRLVPPEAYRGRFAIDAGDADRLLNAGHSLIVASMPVVLLGVRVIKLR